MWAIVTGFYKFILHTLEDTLSELFTQCWGKLLYGSFIADNPFHTGVVGTQNGNEVSLRTVVLRSTDPDEKQLVFYTDFRSAKMTELKSNSNISWLFYDPVEKVQVKISGEAIVHHQDEVSLQHWENVHARGRTAYMSVPGPSTGISEPVDGLEYLNDSDAINENGYTNFTVVITQANFIEWLRLKSSGHRRAQYRLIDGNWKGQWLIP